MSLLEGGVPCEVGIENNDTVDPDPVQTVQNTNAPSCHVEDTDNDSELLKGLLTDTFCQVCEAVLLFESQRVSHYEGKKHAQRVRIFLQSKKAERIKQSQAKSSFLSGNVNPEKFCELCNMVFSSPVVARSHYEGKVHAKNARKSDTTPTTDIKTTAGSVALPAPAREGATGCVADQEQRESAVSPAQEVNLSDPDKYCKLCTASFNNPVMAQQHYSGRKHQRNQARLEMLSKLSSESDSANSLTCPVCCVTLSSVETFQAHMQGNKHFVQEKKIVGLCKSQKKVYDSFQDELADYIQVQKARGLEPKTGPESEAHGKVDEELDESEQFEEKPEIPPPSSHLPPHPPPPPPPCFRPPRWRPPFQPRTGHFGFRGRFPMQHQWGQGYPPHPPPLIPGLTGRSLRRGRSPDSFSSSSSSSSNSSSYSSSSSSSDSSSDSSRDRRRRRRKRKERMTKRREQDDDSDKDERRRSKRRRREGEEEQGHTKKARKERRKSFDEEQGTDEEKERGKWKEKRHREGDSSEGDDYRSKRRVSKKNKRQKEGHYGKRRRVEDEGEWSKESVGEEVVGGEGGVQSEGVQATAVEHTEERTDLREEKSKRRKEKKKVKEKMDEGDNRTEEEKLWDETILGIF
ncbi:zinc finger matrin-type protein 1 isoform X2 [Salminus brasiliensis]|uniref:zinc finger matrin-type protein 1 isoform X2 n=1 Tax=Salminus brasiliensis TaxID=930266 RepID=UPI003B836ACF